MIKIINERNNGSLFHYAHFICDCLFPEIVNEIYKYNKIYRIKNLDQTLGNFTKIYCEIMNCENIEIDEDEFKKLEYDQIILPKKGFYCNINDFNKFREYIFTKYNIDPLIYDSKYPEIILIKRGDRINLIDDDYLKSINTNVTTGKERREINDIDCIENYLNEKYSSKFKSIILENINFKEQVKYFNNAKLIVLAHGAAMANMFFCKEGTKIIEVICYGKWPFFDKISNILNLSHYKCDQNKSDVIIDLINNIN